MQEEQVSGFLGHLLQMILHGSLLSKILFGLLAFASLAVLLIAVYKHKIRKWSALYFVLLSAATLLWALFQLLALLLPESGVPFYSLSLLCFLHIPALLCLHIWKQVSYKEITWLVLVLFFAVPAALTVLYLIQLRQPLELTVVDLHWPTILFYLYAALLLLKSYLLCFNVFYQMPRHMRKSSYYLLVGISSLTLFFISQILDGQQLILRMVGNQISGVILPLLCPLALCITLYTIYNACRVAPSSTVIATSRDFVFSSLTTTILVLSNSQRILDWNKKNGSIAPLPTPEYRETFEEYRARVLRSANGKVSPHGENIISLTVGDQEIHYLISMREIGTRRRKFGHLVEFSEVTKLYSVLRYWEEIAMRDHLTNLYNRNAYINVVHQVVSPQNMPLAVVVGDVNHLKLINDNAGHLVGDDLLIAVSGLIERCQPPGSFAARIGGDEYVVLIPGGSAQQAVDFINTVNGQCGSIYDERYGTPSISWGYALMENAGQDYNEVFSCADQMMYQTKRQSFQFRSSGFIPDKRN